MISCIRAVEELRKLQRRKGCPKREVVERTLKQKKIVL